MERGP